MTMRFFVLLLILFLCSVSARTNQQLQLETDSDGYVLGEGYNIPATPIYLGGYFSLEYSDYHKLKRREFSLDDLALMSYGEYKKLSYMAEFEFKELYKKQWSGNDVSDESHNTKLYAERVYADYTHNEHLRVRAGKYNSDVGYWNLTPINVLRDTTSSPVTSEIIFPKYTTGADIRYREFLPKGDLTFNLTLQDNASLDEEYNNFYIHKHIAGGMEYAVDMLRVKFDLGYFHKKDHTQRYVDNYYAYVAAKYESERWKWMGEFGHRREKAQSIVKFSGFVQGVYELAPRHYPLFRIEYFDAKERVEYDDVKQDTGIVVGYTYRPLYPVALKIEYQFHQKTQLNEMLTSFSVMF